MDKVPAVTSDLIIKAYWLLLGRAPENELVPINGLKSFKCFDDVRRSFFASAEFRHAIRAFAISSKCSPLLRITTEHEFSIYVSLTDIGPSFEMTEGEYEPESTAWILSELRGGVDFLDVGANLGWYSLLVGSRLRALGKGGKVFSVECNREMLPMLSRSISENDLFNYIQVLPVAAHHEFGNVQFMSDSTHPGGAGFSEDGGGSASDVYDVRTAPLDRMLPADSKIGLIKMDIEGAELLAIKGLADTIGRCRPSMIVEINAPRLAEVSKVSPRQFLEYMSSIDYQVYSISGDRLTFEFVVNEVSERVYHNYIFRHRDIALR